MGAALSLVQALVQGYGSMQSLFCASFSAKVKLDLVVERETGCIELNYNIVQDTERDLTLFSNWAF